MTPFAGSKSIRLLGGAVMAIFAGLAVPATALTYGLAHERDAHVDHHAAHVSEHATGTPCEVTSVDHDHPQIDAVPGTRVAFTLVAIVVS